MIRLFFMMWDQNSVMTTGLKGCADEGMGVAVLTWGPVCVVGSQSQGRSLLCQPP